jgi:hypothetical protein
VRTFVRTVEHPGPVMSVGFVQPGPNVAARARPRARDVVRDAVMTGRVERREQRSP